MPLSCFLHIIRIMRNKCYGNTVFHGMQAERKKNCCKAPHITSSFYLWHILRVFLWGKKCSKLVKVFIKLSHLHLFLWCLGKKEQVWTGKSQNKCNISSKALNYEHSPWLLLHLSLTRSQCSELSNLSLSGGKQPCEIAQEKWPPL